jgi:tRNA modification GTPase
MTGRRVGIAARGAWKAWVARVWRVVRAAIWEPVRPVRFPKAMAPVSIRGPEPDGAAGLRPGSARREKADLESDTIVAIATAQGVGALAVVRLSGKDAVAICDRVCRSKQRLASAPDRMAMLGEVTSKDGRPIDQVIVLVMRGPASATGEDVVEITCHGGLLAPRLVLRRLVEEGARPAGPGEFTRQAFLNGKIDLAQAEAVEEVVRASSEKALAAAVRQLEGGLSQRIGGIEDTLIRHLALLEANIDFVEEEIDPVDGVELVKVLEAAARDLEGLLRAHEGGRYLREGLAVVIVGRPNVGKSSLFNRLVGQDRVIVSEIPGTTRDVVDGLVGVDGVVLRIHDTAGVRQPTDGLEGEAVRRTRLAMAEADLAVVMVDARDPLTDEDRRILDEVAGTTSIVVANKVDLDVGGEAHESKPGKGGEVVKIAARISALKGWGISELTGMLAAAARSRIGDLDCEVLVNERHTSHLRVALEATRRGVASIAEGVPLEFVASDVRSALESLGEITGRKASGAVLDEIFSRFCIGK